MKIPNQVKKYLFSGGCLVLIELAATFLDPGIALFRAVMIGPEPVIEWRFEGAVVAVTIAMVLLMEEIPNSEPDLLTQMQILETAMRDDRAKRMKLQDKYDVYRVGQYKQEYKNIAQPHQVLERMHGCARPWAGIGISMMNAVHMPI